MLSCVATYLQSCLDQDTITVIRIKHLMATLNNIKTLATKLDKLQLSDTEFAYLLSDGSLEESFATFTTDGSIMSSWTLQ